MTIRADSFSSVNETLAYTRHLLDGAATFDVATRPTLSEIEKFIDRSSGVLNVALAGEGFTPSAVYGNSTAKLSCDDWVTMKATKYVELTQRGTGYSAAEGSRTAAFSMTKDAQEFAEVNAIGFIQIGITQGIKLSDGLAFTGLDAQKDRTDRTDTSLEQPYADRNQFDNNE